jgi:hypothetical protein
VWSPGSPGISLLVTLTDPAGDPDLLQRVIEVDHDRLAGLLSEASRDTDTPGVAGVLSRTLVGELLQHLNAEAAVVHPVVASALGDDPRRVLAEEARTLESVATTARQCGDLSVLAQALGEHRERMTTTLHHLRSEVGPSRMAALGYEYGHAVEAGSRRRLT